MKAAKRAGNEGNPASTPAQPRKAPVTGTRQKRARTPRHQPVSSPEETLRKFQAELATLDIQIREKEAAASKPALDTDVAPEIADDWLREHLASAVHERRNDEASQRLAVEALNELESDISREGQASEKQATGGERFSDVLNATRTLGTLRDAESQDGHAKSILYPKGIAADLVSFGSLPMSAWEVLGRISFALLESRPNLLKELESEGREGMQYWSAAFMSADAFLLRTLQSALRAHQEPIYSVKQFELPPIGVTISMDEALRNICNLLVGWSGVVMRSCKAMKSHAALRLAQSLMLAEEANFVTADDNDLSDHRGRRRFEGHSEIQSFYLDLAQEVAQ